MKSLYIFIYTSFFCTAAAFAQTSNPEDPRLIYPTVENSAIEPYSSIGDFGSGTGELVRSDLVLTAAHVAVGLTVGISEFGPGVTSEPSDNAPFGRYKVKEIIYSVALQSSNEIMEHIKTGSKYWETEAKADFAFVRIELIDFTKWPKIHPLKLSKSDPCTSSHSYYLTGYPGLWPMGTQRSNTESFASFGCSSDGALIYFNGLTIRGFSGGMVSETKSPNAEIAGILVAGARAPGKGRCSETEMKSSDAQHCGLWAISANIIASELDRIQ